ncbi:MAG: hypothetical protein ABIJ27_04460, partial [Candidatus Omnitrophota bacterium]
FHTLRVGFKYIKTIIFRKPTSKVYEIQGGILAVIFYGEPQKSPDTPFGGIDEITSEAELLHSFFAYRNYQPANQLTGKLANNWLGKTER